MRPAPSAIVIGDAAPFGDCFARAEAEIMAALYVEACRERGDRWQPIGPKEIGETMKRLGTIIGEESWSSLRKRGAAGPLWLAWCTPIFMMGGSPDVHTLVKRGWFTKDGDHGPIEPTDLFFEVLAAKGRISNHRESTS